MTFAVLPGQLVLDLDSAESGAEPKDDPGADPLPGYIQSERIVPLIEAWLARDETRHLAMLAEVSEVSTAALRRLMRGETSTLRFRTADRIICAMGDPMIWHRPPPEGLGDLYRSPLVARAGRAPATPLVSTLERKAAPAAVGRPEARPRKETLP